MIIEFKIKNFRSYQDETSFTFEALNESFSSNNYSTVEMKNGEKIRLLKSAAIFGANASGKSNIIWALQALSFLVANSRNFDVRMAIPVYLPFLLNSRTRNDATEMSIDFIVNLIHYRYIIHYKNIFTFEGLYVIEQEEDIDKKKKEQIKSVFEIDGKNASRGRSFIGGEAWQSETLELAGDVMANQLFLSICGTKPKNGLLDVYAFLANIQAEPVGDSINLKKNNENVAATILKSSNSPNFERLRRLIHIADMGINDVIMKEHGEHEFTFPDSIPNDIKKEFIEDNRWEFSMVHKLIDGNRSSSIVLPISIESAGTKSLFGLGARIIDVLDRGGVLAYDEINIAIHPALFKLLVSLFHDKKSNPNNAQLLFTTHDITIANDSLLRADQIWFAEKDTKGRSQLYSAQDFDDVGINIPFEKWYHAGRFGALPKFGNIEYIFDHEK